MDDFPWKNAKGHILKECESNLPIEMVGSRDVTQELKKRYKEYLVPCKRCKFRFEKNGNTTGICEKCQEKIKING